MTDLAEVIDVLRGHARSSTCTLEPRDCAALVAALERVRMERNSFRGALFSYVKHDRGCNATRPRRTECSCGLDDVLKETKP